MNRIEAINAMLEGKEVEAPGFYPMRIVKNRFEILNLIGSRGWEKVHKGNSCLDAEDGYSIHEEPSSGNYVMIDGEKWKLTKVEE